MSTKTVSHRPTVWSAGASLVLLPAVLTIGDAYCARRSFAVPPIALIGIEGLIGFSSALLTWIVWAAPFTTSQRRRDVRCAWGFGVAILAFGGAAAISAAGGFWLVSPLLASLGALFGQGLAKQQVLPTRR